MNLAGIAFIILMAIVLIAAAIHTWRDERQQRSGISGSAEPQWTDGPGDRTDDGSVIWVNRGRSNR
jgi:hypothetical protein